MARAEDALAVALVDQPRLAALGAGVPAGAVAADIGTDHARLPIAWVTSGHCPEAFAVDVAEAPLQRARRNIADAGIAKRVRVVRSDGFDALDPDTLDAATIGGMGGRTIASIIARGPEPRCGRLSRVAVQPNKHGDLARSALLDRGWRLSTERLVEDRGRIYPVLVFDASTGWEASALSPAQRFVGPLLPADPLWPRWFAQQQAWMAPRAAALRDAGDAHATGAETALRWLREADER